MNVMHPPKTIARARQLWGRGLSMTEIGKAMGVSKNIVAGLSHRNGFPERPSPIGERNSEALIKRVRKLWDDRLTAAQIGKRVGKTEGAIRKIAHKNGFPRRGNTTARSVITPNGTYPSINAAIQATGVCGSTIRYRAEQRINGWSFAND